MSNAASRWRVSYGRPIAYDIVDAPRRFHPQNAALISVGKVKHRIVPDAGALDPALMWQSLLDRIEHRTGFQRVPVPESIGSCIFLNDIARWEIEHSVTALNERTSVPSEPILER